MRVPYAVRAVLEVDGCRWGDLCGVVEDVVLIPLFGGCTAWEGERLGFDGASGMGRGGRYGL